MSSPDCVVYIRMVSCCQYMMMLCPKFELVIIKEVLHLSQPWLDWAYWSPHNLESSPPINGNKRLPL
ncbi:hypothetical protein CEXT_325601 [Caerostris extrusa]|uniref:Uncharacterized protein n=1 Tax=Caerostris extrusa TaxID=172846 RepID=A0AAV4SCN8_CAEEX|nr:hypothetical protein CEXT_325601 [Caerostris extrusa]